MPKTIKRHASPQSLNAAVTDPLRGVSDSLGLPLVSALLFGLMGATSPCQLTTNASALAYVARGSLRGNVSGDDKLYDIAAALLIATEAGCRAEWLSSGEVSLSSWLDGSKPDELMLVAPPQILAALRATFLGL